MADRRLPAVQRIAPVRLLLLAAYLVVIFPTLMYFNVGLVPDVLVFVLLGAAVVVGQLRRFVLDWGVFLLVVVLWQQTGPVAHWAGFPLHMSDLINADRTIMYPLLHGALPQVWLQQHLFHRAYTVRTVYHAGYWQGHVYHHAYFDHVFHPIQWQWYDVVSWAVYGLHFPEPLVVGFVLWLYNRSLFRRFAAAFLALAAIAFGIYIIYPAVPPWLASDYGKHSYHAIPSLIKIFSAFNDHVLRDGLGHHYTYVLHVDYNQTAAMPSLHAAFPVLSALYLRKLFGRWGWLMLGYAAIVWFAVVYMAEHWVVDVAAGVVCVVIAYALVEGVAAYLAARRAAQPAMTVPALAASVPHVRPESDLPPAAGR